MFNAERKQRFIAARFKNVLGVKRANYFFDSVEEFERMYNCDIAQMNVDQLQNTFNNVAGLRSKNAQDQYRMFRDYIEWCRKCDLEPADSIYAITVGTFDNMRSRMVGSPLHLKDILDQVFPHPDGNSIEYIYRTYLWLAFSGFLEEEAIRVCADDVRFTSAEILDPESDRAYPFYAESYPDIHMACTLTFFCEPRGKGKVCTIKQRQDGNEILRGKVTQKTIEEQLTSTIRPTISRAFRKYAQNNASGASLSYRRIYMSGIFYRKYESDRIGKNDDGMFREIATRDILMSHRITQKSSAAQAIASTVREYKSDYASWKHLFT